MVGRERDGAVLGGLAGHPGQGMGSPTSFGQSWGWVNEGQLGLGKGGAARAGEGHLQTRLSTGGVTGGSPLPVGWQVVGKCGCPWKRQLLSRGCQDTGLSLDE